MLCCSSGGGLAVVVWYGGVLGEKLAVNGSCDEEEEEPYLH
jgi:hypothetical protein